MLPILFESYLFTLYAYPLFMGLAWGFGYFLTDLIFQKNEIDGNTLLPLYTGLFFSSWTGAKVFYLIFSSKDLFHRHLVSENFWLGGGFVFYGGLIFGVLYYLIYSLGFRKFNIKNTKFLLPGLIFGHAIGRIGCFLAGCCFGSECDIFLSVKMHGKSLHPVQLYEAIGLLLIGLTILKSIKSGRKNVVLEYLILYSFLRFFVEFYRGDSVRGYVGEVFSTSQIISGIILTISLVSLLIKVKRNKAKL